MNYLEKLLSISNTNKYAKWYASIVNTAINRNSLIEYYEMHHILPKSFNMGGERDTRNIIKVTAREHFLLHYLLCKMNTPFNLKVFFAFGKMKCDRYNKRYFNSHLYEYFRKNVARNLSIVKKNKISVNKNNKTKFILKENLDDYLLNGWVLGQYSSEITTQKRILANKKRKDYIWINDGVYTKHIPKSDITTYLNNGWVLGRINIKKGYTITNTTKMSDAQQNRAKTSIRMINIHTNEIRYFNKEIILGDEWIHYSPPKINKGKLWFNDGYREYLLLPELADKKLQKGRLKPTTLTL